MKINERWEEGKCKKKLQVIVNLTCLGQNTAKRKILMHNFWFLQRSSTTKRL